MPALAGPTLMSERVTDAARGKWPGVLAELGIPRQFLNGKNQPCPLCGGKDRARFSNKNGDGMFICNKCGAGSGLTLLMRFHGWEAIEAVRKVWQVLGQPLPERESAPERSDRAKREAMSRLWRSSSLVRPGDPVALYLGSRGITTLPSNIRYVERLIYAGEPPTYHPAMIARVCAPDGGGTMLHRTYLTRDGHKAEVDVPRRMMPGTVVPGSAVRLMSPAEAIGVAEGIETALSAAEIFGLPCWAALNAQLLTRWEPPLGPRLIVIFGDNDASFAGQAAAYELARRLSGKGPEIEVRIPDQVGTDWNDVHQVRRS